MVFECMEGVGYLEIRFFGLVRENMFGFLYELILVGFRIVFIQFLSKI